MKTLKTIFTIAILTLSISCSKDEPQPQPETPKVTTVYVGGAEYDNTTQKDIPIIWKDGVAQQLPIAAGNEGEVLAIFVDGNDVYAVGHENSSTSIATYKAVMWKNGVKTTLSTNSSSANSVYVANGTAYVVGMENQTATLWHNNTTRNFTEATEATDIYVKGNDIYISGNTTTGMGFWKINNEGTYFTNTISQSNARSICVQENNIYIAGFELSTANIRSAKLWNDNLLSTGQYGDDTSMWSVYAQGQNVYACGFKVVNLLSTRAMLWKNNQATQLSQNPSFAYSVFATATDNYVAGYETISITKACIWKNGTTQILSANSSAATSVFVTEK
ncbi:hypothetical protein [Flavobacterium sp.]|uniref:hypothetical protein n=1 Tax=Flavobacterium sp. TaxID=239 RepID=UPI00286D707D|nr:hypothetical protein [Flavobacterium sp.]